MVMKLVVPTINQRPPALSVCSKVVTEERSNYVISQQTYQLVVPCICELPRCKTCGVSTKRIKKRTNMKRWKDFNRQARRREKRVTLEEDEYTRIIAQRCTYCSSEGNTGVDRVRNKEAYSRENSVPCCGQCNMAKRNSSLRAFVQKARSIAKTLRSVGELERSSSCLS